MISAARRGAEKRSTSRRERKSTGMRVRLPMPRGRWAVPALRVAMLSVLVGCAVTSARCFGGRAIELNFRDFLRCGGGREIGLGGKSHRIGEEHGGERLDGGVV